MTGSRKSGSASAYRYAEALNAHAGPGSCAATRSDRTTMAASSATPACGCISSLLLRGRRRGRGRLVGIVDVGHDLPTLRGLPPEHEVLAVIGDGRAVWHREREREGALLGGEIAGGAAGDR